MHQMLKERIDLAVPQRAIGQIVDVPAPQIVERMGTVQTISQARVDVTVPMSQCLQF